MSWTQSRFGPDQSAFAPLSSISPANVGTLTHAFTGPAPTAVFAQTLAYNGTVFIETADNVQAIDARGETGCADGQCQPLWTTDRWGTNAVVGGDHLFVQTDLDAFSVYDANGIEGCSGTPTVCAPLWTLTAPTTGGDYFLGFLTATNDVVYVHAPFTANGPGPQHPVGHVLAFDAHGSQNCSGDPKTCAPLWDGATNLDDDRWMNAPTVAGGRIYLNMYGSTSGHAPNIAIFDATGTTNCSGTPKVCGEVGNIAVPAIADTPLAVHNGHLYANSEAYDPPTYEQRLTAFDNVGTVVWQSDLLTDGGSPTVAGGRVFTTATVAGEQRLLAYDESGTQGCSGTPKLCTPLWSGTLGSPALRGAHTPIIAAGNVVYVATSNAVLAFDARGSEGCSGTPVVCTALFNAPGFASGYPIVLNDTLFLARSTGVDAFRLPTG